MLLLASPVLLLSNSLLQPAQAQTPMTFKTPHPAIGEVEGERASLTFDAQGTLSTNSSGYQKMNGTFQITSGQRVVLSGDIERGLLSNNSHGVVSIALVSPNATIGTSCSTSDTKIIQVN